MHFNSLYAMVLAHQSGLLYLHGTVCNKPNPATPFKNPFESKWKADAVLPLHDTSAILLEFRIFWCKGTGKIHAELLRGCQRHRGCARGSSLGLHRCVTSRWDMGWAAPTALHGQCEISWLGFPLTAEAGELHPGTYTSIGQSAAPLFSSPVKVQRSIGTPATRNPLFWPNSSTGYTHQIHHYSKHTGPEI